MLPSGTIGEGEDPRRWLTLAVVLLAGLMDLLDLTIVNLAIPQVPLDLGASQEAIQWVVAGYALGLITGGRPGDIFGRKQMLLFGVAGFTVASAFCGAAGNPEMPRSYLRGFENRRVVRGSSSGRSERTSSSMS
jgi:MFS family permease